jgi:hypothetical protein
MGLGRPPHADAWANRLMTVAWYTLGGLAAGCTYQQLHAQHGALDRYENEIGRCFSES